MTETKNATKRNKNKSEKPKRIQSHGGAANTFNLLTQEEKTTIEVKPNQNKNGKTHGKGRKANEPTGKGRTVVRWCGEEFSSHHHLWWLHRAGWILDLKWWLFFRLEKAEQSISMLISAPVQNLFKH
jgi:hypothetical protein